MGEDNSDLLESSSSLIFIPRFGGVCFSWSFLRPLLAKTRRLPSPAIVPRHAGPLLVHYADVAGIAEKKETPWARLLKVFGPFQPLTVTESGAISSWFVAISWRSSLIFGFRRMSLLHPGGGDRLLRVTANSSRPMRNPPTRVGKRFTKGRSHLGPRFSGYFMLQQFHAWIRAVRSVMLFWRVPVNLLLRHT